MYDVKFYGGKYGDKGIIGVIVELDGMLVDTFIKELNIPNETNLDLALRGFKYAVDIVYKEGYEDVTFYNNNKLVFDWVQKGTSSTELKQKLVNEINRDFEIMYEEFGINISYKYGKEVVKDVKKMVTNEAKASGANQVSGKFIPKNSKDTTKHQSVKKEENKIVPFGRRKQA